MADTNELQGKILAQAVYEIRLLLGGYVESGAECDPAVRQAAHLAFALHNEALAVLSGGAFDIASAMVKIDAVDELIGSQFRATFVEVLGEDS